MLRFQAMFFVLLLGPGLARADVVFLKDGRTIEGVVASAEGKSVVVSRALGAVEIPRDQVDRIERRETPEQELARRTSSLTPGDHDAALSLLRFCLSNGFDAEARTLATQLQRERPGIAGLAAAWAELDFHVVDGEWVAPEVYYPARGYERVNGRWLAPEHARLRRASRGREDARETAAAAKSAFERANNSADVADLQVEWARTAVERLERNGPALEESARSAAVELRARQDDVRVAEIAALAGDGSLGLDPSSARWELDAAVVRLRAITAELGRLPAALADARSYLRRAEAAARVARLRATEERAQLDRANAAVALAEAEFVDARRSR